jgi:hypothetical protein
MGSEGCNAEDFVFCSCETGTEDTARSGYYNAADQADVMKDLFKTLGYK